MNRTQLRRIVAELRERNPDVEFSLHPRFVRPPYLTSRHYRVNLTVRVTQPIYFDPLVDISDEEALAIAQEEIAALWTGTDIPRLHQARIEYLHENRHTPAARRILESEAPAPRFRFYRPPNGDAPPEVFYGAGPAAIPPSTANALQVLEALARPAQPPTSAAAPGTTAPASEAQKPEAMTLWERLDDGA